MAGMNATGAVETAPESETPALTLDDFGRIALLLAAIAYVTIAAVVWLDQVGIHLPTGG